MSVKLIYMFSDFLHCSVLVTNWLFINYKPFLGVVYLLVII